MDNPRFSVIIPTLNEERFLPSLLFSLVAQSKKNFEVIVVDGKSRDKTIAKAVEFRKKLKLRVITSDHASLPLQRNIGAAEARGEWLVFIDADSVLFANFFDQITRFIDFASPHVFTTWFAPDSKAGGDAVTTLLANIMNEVAILLKRPFTPGPLTIVTKSAFELVGGYDESRQFHEDVDFGMRLYERAGITVQILRETLCILSLRRLRREGTLKVIQQYALAALPVLFLKRSFRSMPGGYVMGGQLYGKKKK